MTREDELRLIDEAAARGAVTKLPTLTATEIADRAIVTLGEKKKRAPIQQHWDMARAKRRKRRKSLAKVEFTR